MSTTVPSGASHKQSKTQVMTGADIVVHSLVEHGVEVVFAYPGGCSMPMLPGRQGWGLKAYDAWGCWRRR